MRGRGLKLFGSLFMCAVVVLSGYQIFRFTTSSDEDTENTSGNISQLPQILSAPEVVEGEMVFNFSEDEIVATLASITPVGSEMDEIRVDCTEDGRMVADFALSRKAYNEIIKRMEGQADQSNLLSLLKAIRRMMDSIPIYLDITAAFSQSEGIRVQINEFTFCFIEINKKYYAQLEETVTQEVNNYFRKSSKLKLSSFNVNDKGIYVKLVH